MDYSLAPPSNFKTSKKDFLSPKSFNNSVNGKNENLILTPLFEKMLQSKSNELELLAKESLILKNDNEQLRLQILELLNNDNEQCKEMKENFLNMSKKYSEAVDLLSQERLNSELNNNRISQLQSQLEISLNNLDISSKDSAQKIKDLEMKNKELKEECDQSKRYLSNAEFELGKLTDIKLILTALENKNKLLSDENCNLINQNSLLNMKLESIFEMTSIQEKLVSTVSTGKKQDTLLKKWREKVFDLIVQSKTQLLIFKNEKRNWHQKENELTKEVETANLEKTYLEACKEHQKVELNLKEQQILLLNKTIDQLNEKFIIENKNIQEYKINLESIIKVIKNFESSNFEDIYIKLNILHNRIKFATQRIHFLQAQLAQKDANMVFSKINPILVNISTQTEQYDVLMSLELEKVIAERDLLTSQLLEQSTKIPLLISDAVSSANEENLQLHDAINKMTFEINEKDKKLLELETEIKDCNDKYVKLVETIDIVKSELELEKEKYIKDTKPLSNMQIKTPLQINLDQVTNMDAIETVDLMNIINEVKMLTNCVLQNNYFADS